MAIRVVVILKAVKSVVMSVTVDGAHRRTLRVAAVEIAAMAHTEEMENWK